VWALLQDAFWFSRFDERENNSIGAAGQKIRKRFKIEPSQMNWPQRIAMASSLSYN
jgi:hypothetical protein